MVFARHRWRTAHSSISILLLVHSLASIVRIDGSGKASAALIENAELLIYEGAPHGLADTYKDRLNQDFLTFLRKQ